MKKLLFLCLVAGTLNAQTSNSLKGVSMGSSNKGEMGLAKKNLLLSGALGFISNENAGVTTNSFSFSPAAIYMLKDNIGVGGRLTVDGGSGRDAVFGFGVDGMYVFTPRKQFSLALNGDVSFKFPTGMTQISVGVSPGINYFVHSNWALMARLGRVGFDITSVSGAGSSVGMNLGVDFRTIGFGVAYVIK
ncbi:MAG: hypothetical protein JNL75_06510 [Chitinophagales bacterium]|nr:hypothetical protein [Chitinophagales bacterium]